MYKRGSECFFPGRQGKGRPFGSQVYLRQEDLMCGFFTEAAFSGINQVMFLGKLNG